MIQLTLHGKPLAAWLVPKTPPARRARFVRHHLHHLTVHQLTVFSDDAAEHHAPCKLLDLTVGEYELHVGEGRLVKLVVTALEINLDGVQVIETPDRGYHYMPAMHLGAMTELGLLGRLDLVPWAYAQASIEACGQLPPLGTTLPDAWVRYRLLPVAKLPEGLFTFSGTSFRLIGKIEVGTGRIIPLEELEDEANEAKLVAALNKLTEELG